MTRKEALRFLPFSGLGVMALSMRAGIKKLLIVRREKSGVLINWLANKDEGIVER